MQISKMGITVGCLGAMIYFSGLFGGYFITILLVGYVLLFEENAWLKRSAIKAVSLLIFFSILTEVFNLIPNFISFINNLAYVVNGSFSITILSSIVSAIIVGINIVKTILFLGLGFKALNQGTIVIPFIDKMISNYMN